MQYDDISSPDNPVYSLGGSGFNNFNVANANKQSDGLGHYTLDDGVTWLNENDGSVYGEPPMLDPAKWAGSDPVGNDVIDYRTPNSPFDYEDYGSDMTVGGSNGGGGSFLYGQQSDPFANFDQNDAYNSGVGGGAIGQVNDAYQAGNKYIGDYGGSGTYEQADGTIWNNGLTYSGDGQYIYDNGNWLTIDEYNRAQSMANDFYQSGANAYAESPPQIKPVTQADWYNYDNAAATNSAPFQDPGYESPNNPSWMQEDPEQGGFIGAFKKSAGMIGNTIAAPYVAAENFFSDKTDTGFNERVGANFSGEAFQDTLGIDTEYMDWLREQGILGKGAAYGIDTLTAPATIVTAGLGPSAGAIGSAFTGNFGKRLAGETALGVAGYLGADAANSDIADKIPYFSDQPDWLRSLEGGAIGGFGAYGGIKAGAKNLDELGGVKGILANEEGQFPRSGMPEPEKPIDTASLFENKGGITGRGIPEGRGELAGNPIPQTNLFGDLASPPVFRGDETPAIMQARQVALDTLAGNREIRRSGVTAAEVSAGRSAQAGGILEGYEKGLATGLSGGDLLDSAVDSIPSGRIIKTNAGEITATDRNALKDVVAQWMSEDPKARVFEARTARDVLDAMSMAGGYMPQPAEDALLRKILGDELTDTVGSRLRGANVKGAEIEFPTRPLALGEQTKAVQPPIEPLEAGKYVTPEAQAQRFADDMAAKQQAGDDFITRLRNSQREGAPPLSLKDEALLGANPVTLSPADKAARDTLISKQRKEMQDWLAEQDKKFREDFASRGRNPNARDLQLGQGGQQLSISDAGPVNGKFKSVPEAAPRSVTPIKIINAAKALGWEIISAPRSIKSSLDLSAALRQGGKLGAGHPKNVPAAFKAQLRAWGSENAAKQIDASLDARPNARIHKVAELYRAPLDNAKIGDGEEAFLSRMLNHSFGVPIPGTGKKLELNLVSASQRAYVTYLNKLRADVFDSVWNGLPELERTSETAKALGRFINVASGRGELSGLLEGSSPLLSQVFFSPRNLISGPQAIKMAVTGNGSSVVRKEAMRTMAAYFAGTATLVSLGKVAGIWDVETDPRSADFGKIRIGPQRIDPWGGYSQLTRMFAQEITGQKKTTTIDGENEQIYDVGHIQPLASFTRSKLSPVVGETFTQLYGKDFKGDPASKSPIALLENLFAPIGPAEVRQAYEDYGWQGAAMSIPGLLGYGTQLYAPNEKDKKSEAEFGVPYSAQTPKQRIEYNDKFGAEVSKNEDVRIAMEKATTAQQGADQKIKDMGLNYNTGKEWRDAYGDNKDNLRFLKDVVYADAGTKPGSDKVLDAYYAQMDASVKYGKPDWDKLDTYVKNLDPKDQQYIKDHTGFLTIDTPETRKFEAAKDKIDDSGYFDRFDQNWATTAKNTGVKFSSYDEWYASEQERLLKALGKNKNQPGAVAEVDGVISRLEPAKMMDALGTQWREDWAIKNPQAAYDAWRYGYYNPTKELKAFLSAKFE